MATLCRVAPREKPVPRFPRQNNLDVLRLYLATQVMIGHAAAHFHLVLPPAIGGPASVPAFFFISGFLIYASYLNAPGRRYFENRFLRLWPGLVVVTIGGAAIALTAHGWRDLMDHFPSYLSWFVMQITLGQGYNPPFFRDVGVGVINPALWTLTVEILFYCSVPLIVWMERRWRFTVLALLVLSFAIYVIGPRWWVEPVYRDKTMFDFIALTPIPWGWMFAFGILAVKRFDVIQRAQRFLPLALIPAALMFAYGSGPLFEGRDNHLGIIFFVFYVALVLWLAFATPYLRVKYDISYGTYIWHMPVINLLLILAVPNPLLAFGLTFAIAALSCLLVEQPALKLKRRSLKPVETPSLA